MLDEKKVLDYLKELKGTWLGIKHVTQPNTKLCWATCYKMIDHWHQSCVTRTFCEYINLETDACNKCARPIGLCNRPRDPKHILSDLKVLGYGKTTQSLKPLSLPQIDQEIRERRPIMAYLNYRNGDAHVFLITGITFLPNLFAGLILADPLEKNLSIIEFSELGSKGDWQMSWAVE